MQGRGGSVAIFVRWPEPGRVLPSLVRRLGADASAQLYEAFINDMVAAAPLGAAQSYLYALDHLDAFREMFPGMAVRPQQGTSEGRRLQACFGELLAGSSKAIIVGSSLPDLHPRMVRSAFEILDRRDAVVGPTEEGGFYLLGLRRPADIFRGIRWGTGTELVTLLRNLERTGLDYGFFPTRQKVASYEDLLALRRRLLRPMAPITYSTLQLLGIGQEAREVR